MRSTKCEQCGFVGRLSDETCPRCGAELEAADKSLNPTLSDHQTQQVTVVGSETKSEEFETLPAIRPFSGIGAAINSTIELFKDNIWLITKIVFVVFAPFEIFKFLSIGAKEKDWQMVAGTFLLGLCCKALVAPSLIYALEKVIRSGVAPSVNECYHWGLSRLGRLVACALMAWLLEVLGFVCLIIPGFILGVAFELIYPIAALEKLSPVEILKRSYHLTKGYRWNIFGASVVIGLLCGVVNLPAGIVSAILLSNGINFWPLRAALSMATDIVNESTTVLSLVIYLGISIHTPVDDARLTGPVGNHH